MEATLLNRLIERCEAIAPIGDRLSLAMDLSAADDALSMDWERLLAAPDHDFAHDVGGIRTHLDRDADPPSIDPGKFRPRYANE